MGNHQTPLLSMGQVSLLPYKGRLLHAYLKQVNCFWKLKALTKDIIFINRSLIKPIDVTEREIDPKKERPKVKTFSVPFDLKENNEDITKTPNTLSKLSKEQIINQAFKFHSEGNISEATRYYQYFIDQGFSDPKVFNNFGIILTALGQLDEAEILTRKAIELNPKFAEAFANLGNIFTALGQLKDAEFSYRKSIKLNPVFSNAYNNLGTVLRDIDNLEEAEISTRKAIELDPYSSAAHNNLGIILRDIDNLEEAEISTRKAIKINPNYYSAYNNLSIILKDLGKSEEAEISARKAILISSSFSDAHKNLGAILRDLGKLEEAEISTREAIRLKPDCPDSHNTLAFILTDLGKSKEAFNSYISAIKFHNKGAINYTFITQFLRDCDTSYINKNSLEDVLLSLLNRDDISHRMLFNAFNKLYEKVLIKYVDEISYENFSDGILKPIITDKTLIIALKKINLGSYQWELLLRKIRRYFSNIIFKDRIIFKYSEYQFVTALAEQCFLNEYVYSISVEESTSINSIINRCRNGEINETNISILACYFPLYKLIDWIPDLSYFKNSDNEFNNLTKLQILEPKKEFDLSKGIKRLGHITDNVSKKVKLQYEQNPYPRWRYGNTFKDFKMSYIKCINTEIKPNSINSNSRPNKLKILVAGCGTGNQILHAQIFKNAEIQAIDLSSSSLSYSQRKIEELGLSNVDLIQMDLLEVGLLKNQFDIIICSGVLHHMKSPTNGLKALLNVLKPNGFLKIGLYSELSRQVVIKARKYISENKIEPNIENIRIFRDKVFSGELEYLKSLIGMGDFYTSSECRDLCFHVKEHRFTTKQIDQILRSNNLDFLGFLQPQTKKILYSKYYPEDKAQTNLENWGKFEERYPDTFLNMYQFWVCKTKS